MKKKTQTWRQKLLRLLSYSTVYLILNLIMQVILKWVFYLAESNFLEGIAYRNYVLVAFNMLITASLYGGILSNLEGGLERITLNTIKTVHKLSAKFIGLGGSLLLIYYLIFAAYYWNLFGQSILPKFLTQLLASLYQSVAEAIQKI